MSAPVPPTKRMSEVVTMFGRDAYEASWYVEQLEVGMRRAIHLIETLNQYVVWPVDRDHDDIYHEDWAAASLELVREALAGKKP